MSLKKNFLAKKNEITEPKMVLSRLQSLKTISSPERNSSIDVFRGVAILAVVFYHFNGLLPYGHIGVDLFFVISGCLIGGILNRNLKSGIQLNYFKFILQRGFKIWPSYYNFLIIGTVLSIFLYSHLAPEEIIHIGDMARYVFFYQNYTGVPYHWSFDHLWSLCIEEHFYLILPLCFIIAHNKKKWLLYLILFTILCGIVFKAISLYFIPGHDTYAATHNRIDALAWGVLLSFIIEHTSILRSLRFPYLIGIAGAITLTLALLVQINTASEVYKQIVFHSLIPFSCFLMLSGTYYADLSSIKPLRFVAYYSYNWYLWHPILVKFILHYMGFTFFGLIVYLITGFSLAVIFTILVEEKFLEKRRAILNKIFTAKN
jgi:peptidoglycan/LPS O-acetylase OafA/YrhL